MCPPSRGGGVPVEAFSLRDSSPQRGHSPDGPYMANLGSSSDPRAQPVLVLPNCGSRPGRAVFPAWGPQEAEQGPGRAWSVKDSGEALWAGQQQGGAGQGEPEGRLEQDTEDTWGRSS